MKATTFEGIKRLFAIFDNCRDMAAAFEYQSSDALIRWIVFGDQDTGTTHLVNRSLMASRTCTARRQFNACRELFNKVDSLWQAMRQRYFQPKNRPLAELALKSNFAAH